MSAEEESKLDRNHIVVKYSFRKHDCHGSEGREVAKAVDAGCQGPRARKVAKAVEAGSRSGRWRRRWKPVGGGRRR